MHAASQQVFQNDSEELPQTLSVFKGKLSAKERRLNTDSECRLSNITAGTNASNHRSADRAKCENYVARKRSIDEELEGPFKRQVLRGSSVDKTFRRRDSGYRIPRHSHPADYRHCGSPEKPNQRHSCDLDSIFGDASDVPESKRTISTTVRERVDRQLGTPHGDEPLAETDTVFFPRHTPHYRLIGEYSVEIGSLIGAGGYSSVYSVKDVKTHKQYALKIVQFTNNVLPHIRANLLEEVRTLNSLVGVKHVIQLLAHDTTKSDHIEMLMELGQGDLQEILQSFQDSDTSLTIEFIRYWGGQVLQAVAAVHDHNIVHADLKPANFVIVNGSLKLIDFGIANTVPQNTTSVHRQSAVGTLMYMAPETLTEMPNKIYHDNHTKCGASNGEGVSNCNNYDNNNNNNNTSAIVGINGVKSKSEPAYKVTKASDVWSCGVILFEMIYQRHPYNPATYLHEAQRSQLSEVAHRTHTRDGMAVPLALHEVIRDCLQLEPQKRCTAQAAAKSLFFTPVSVDLQALMDIAWGIRAFSLRPLSARRPVIGDTGDPKDEPKPRSGLAGDEHCTKDEDWMTSDNNLFKQDKALRREFERFVCGLYRKLVKMNTGNRYRK